MKNIKKSIFVVNSFVLTSLYAVEQKIVDLKNIINPQEVSAKVVDAWNFAQKSSEDANFLELTAKIRRIQTCSDCSAAEKRLFIILLNNPGINLFKDYAEMNKIFVDNLKKYKNYIQICDVGDVEKCQVALTQSILQDMFREAIKNNRLEMIALLIDVGLNIQGDPASSSPLISATTNNNIALARLLVNKGADVNFKGYNGDTALKVAQQKGNKEIVGILKKAGAR